MSKETTAPPARSYRLVAVGLAILLGAPGAQVAAQDAVRRVVIVNLADTEARSAAVDPADLPPELHDVGAMCSRPGGADEIRRCFPCLIPNHRLRFTSDVADVIQVYVLYRGDRPEIRFTETPRQSRLARDLATLIKLAGPLAGLALDERPVACEARTYRLQRRRANVKVSVAQPATETAGAETTGAKTELELVAGPTEHWFLSADVPFRKGTKLAFDDKTGALAPKEAPSHFFVGFDYMLGDLLSDRRPWWQGVVLKAMIKASREPLDAFGLAVGLRGRFLAPVLDLDTFSPFVGVLLTRNDETAASAGRHFERQWQIGFSVNLDQALGWTKSE